MKDKGNRDFLSPKTYRFLGDFDRLESLVMISPALGEPLKNIFFIPESLFLFLLSVASRAFRCFLVSTDLCCTLRPLKVPNWFTFGFLFQTTTGRLNRHSKPRKAKDSQVVYPMAFTKPWD